MSSTPGTEPDLTRKERREQARSERKALEANERASVARRRRLIQLGGVIAVAIVVIVIVAIAAGGGGGSSAPKLKKNASGSLVPSSTAVQSRFAGLAQNGVELGSPKAPVTLQEFADLQCPFCREYTFKVLPSLIGKYVRTGKLRMEFHNYDIISAESVVAAKMAMAAAKQNRLWNFVDLFYANQQAERTGYVTTSFLQQIASGIPGLNVNKALAERSAPAIEAQVTADNRLASRYTSQFSNVSGFNGTPSFMLFKTGTTPQLYQVTSLSEPSAFEAEIDKLLKG
jgi:protein-disulfide isomerase